MTREEEDDLAAIRRTITHYNASGDRGRVDDLIATFAPDGVLVTPGFGEGPVTYSGRDEISANLTGKRIGQSGANRPMLLSRHHQTTCDISLDGPDTARARTYFLLVSEIGPDHSGIYVDSFRRIDGAWKIARREVRIDWVAENGHTWVTRSAR